VARWSSKWLERSLSRQSLLTLLSSWPKNLFGF